MGRSAVLAALVGTASAFAVGGVAHSSAFAPASGRLPLAPAHPACATRARSVLPAPALRGARHGLLAARAVEYTVQKGGETKNGGHTYTFTVTVDGDMSKDSYGERSGLCARRVRMKVAGACARVRDRNSVPHGSQLLS